MISSSDREIVGPGYTTEPDIMGRVAHGKARQEQNKKRSMETKIEMLNSQTEETLHRQSLGEDNSSQNKTKAAEAPDGAGAKTTPLGTKPLPRWCPTSLTKMQRPRVQKLWAREIAEKRRDEERDWWFNQEWPIVDTKKTWKEKCIEREEKGDSSGSGDRREDYEAVGDVEMKVHLDP
jgi:transglutaminase/protease-like cytokinesis protein 3